MSQSDLFESNPERYARLSVPFEDSEEAAAAIEAFTRDLDELREKHRIANLHVTIGVMVKEEGGSGERMLSFLRGDFMKCVLMLARCYGREKERLEQMFGEQIGAGMRDASERRKRR